MVELRFLHGLSQQSFDPTRGLASRSGTAIVAPSPESALRVGCSVSVRAPLVGRSAWIARGVAALAVTLLATGCATTAPIAKGAIASPSPLAGAAVLVGLDPYATGCASDATTEARTLSVDDRGQTVAVVEIRRSSRCKTSWARAIRMADVRGTLVASVRSARFSDAFEHATDGEVWTDMVPSELACVTATGGVRGESGLRPDATVSSCSDGARETVATK